MFDELCYRNLFENDYILKESKVKIEIENL